MNQSQNGELWTEKYRLRKRPAIRTAISANRPQVSMYVASLVHVVTCQTCHMDSTLTAKYAEPQKQCCCHRRHHPTSSHIIPQPSTATETRKTEGQNSTNSTMTLHQFIAQVHPGRGRGFRAKSQTHAKSNSCPPSLLTYTRLHMCNIWPNIVCTCTDPTTEPIVAHPYTLGFASALASIVDPRGMASRNAAAHFVRAQNVHCRHPRRVTTSFTSVVARLPGPHGQHGQSWCVSMALPIAGELMHRMLSILYCSKKEIHCHCSLKTHKRMEND